MEMEITSASRASQSLLSAAAAAFVITDEDIRRLQYRSIPDLLRIVPGMHIGQIGRSRWSVSSRGLPGEFANNLLVLVDGRAVYTPLFAGTVLGCPGHPPRRPGSHRDHPGPGATLWGSNAVGGIISVVSKSAFDTLGWHVKGGYGTEDNGWGQVRYGDQLSDDAAFRVWFKWFDRDGFVDAAGDDVAGDWAAFSRRLPRRLGHERSRRPDRPGRRPRRRRRGQDAEPVVERAVLRRLHRHDRLLRRQRPGALTRTIDEDEQLTLQVYYDRTDRSLALIDEVRDTFDVDFSHRFRGGDAHALTWGLGYRVSRDRTSSGIFRFAPRSRGLQLFSGFIQDAITLGDGGATLTLGSKFEHNDYTGFEVQPSVRLHVELAEDHAAWAAVSRAVRTPSRADRDLIAPASLTPGGPGTPTNLGVFLGDSGFDSTDLLAFEPGLSRPPHGRTVARRRAVLQRL